MSDFMTLDEKIGLIDKLYSEANPPVGGPADLKAILENFSFGLAELREHLIYPEDLPYGRKCIFQSANFEVVVMNWKPRELSNIHDHGSSFGCVYSISGQANNVLFDENLDQIGSIPLINNNIAEVPCGIYHVIENQHDEYAVSLHFYAPPLHGMRVIDRNDKSRSYLVKNEAGAWNPRAGEALELQAE
jgi:cysteine dioxygenase